MNLLNQILSKRNFQRAINQVVSNGGSAGIDGMKVDKLEEFFAKNYQTIVNHIQSGTYQPQAVKGIEIPKPSGGKRLLGIPTVIDRTIQQAIHQVLSPIYEQEFSGFSYGFTHFYYLILMVFMSSQARFAQIRVPDKQFIKH